MRRKENALRRLRPKTAGIMLTPGEYQRLRDLCDQENTSMSEFLRKRIDAEVLLAPTSEPNQLPLFPKTA